MTRTIAFCLCLAVSGATPAVAQDKKKDAGTPDGL
jgi:hypothetical protein